MSIAKKVRRVAVEKEGIGGHDEPCRPGCWVQANGKPKDAAMFGKTMYQATSGTDEDVAQDVRYAALTFSEWRAKARAMR